MSVSASKVHEILASPQFQELVRKRWGVSATLTAVMLIAYFGFILSIAFYREALSHRIGEHLTVGIPLGIGLIVFAWLLTGYYIRWANGSYDQQVRDLRSKILSQ